jgi:2-polyprenyl-3-methyl-5-hydroxy-6-metoxy-1,4-benzoquinol methylase
MTLIDLRQERTRLDSVTGSYGTGVAPFDAAMRGYMMRAFEPWFREGSCLQVGCAHGDQTSLLLDRFAELTVLEPVRSFLEAARARVGGRGRFVQALIEDFDGPERFDNIFFSHVLEHVADPVDCLSRLGERLADPGRLLVAVPNAEAPSRRLAVKMGLLSHLEDLSEADLAAGHRRVYRLESLADEIGRAGLVLEATGGIFFKPLANFQFDALIGGPLIGQGYLDACYELGLDRPADCASIYAVARRGGNAP